MRAWIERNSEQRATLTRAVERWAPLLLFAAIGVELAVLATWLPDTLNVWFDPDTHGYGDFPVFYENARTLHLNALYSPALAVIMHPLTWLPMRSAFAIYFGVNVLSLCGVAYIAQRPLESMPAKAAMALGVFALPQTHWALRVGHFTEVIAFASLAGLLIVDRRPVRGGALLAVLALKPQYLAVPLLYLVWTKNWRALAAAAGIPLVMGVAGIVGLALYEAGGITSIAGSLHYYVERVPATFDFLTSGQRDQSYPQSWQYSWYGFLLSAGIEPNPLVAFDLIALSLGAMLLVWWRCSRDVALVAAALGMLLLTPHTSFYNWSILAVAAALLLRADIRPRALAPVMIGGVALAAAATQNATPFPLPVDIYRPAGTDGFYWVQPAALLSMFALAFAGRRRVVDVPCVDAAPAAMLPPSSRPRLAFAAPFAVAAFAVGALGAGYVTGAGPFERDAYFSRRDVLAALPADFPAPVDARVDSAGAGTSLPYRVEWRTDGDVSEVAGVMRHRLDGAPWRVVSYDASSDGVALQATRTSTGDQSMIARLELAPEGEGTALRLEFSPLPSSSVPGYDRWLRSIGLVVHNVDPAVAASHDR